MRLKRSFGRFERLEGKVGRISFGHLLLQRLHRLLSGFYGIGECFLRVKIVRLLDLKPFNRLRWIEMILACFCGVREERGFSLGKLIKDQLKLALLRSAQLRDFFGVCIACFFEVSNE